MITPDQSNRRLIGHPLFEGKRGASREVMIRWSEVAPKESGFETSCLAKTLVELYEEAE